MDETIKHQSFVFERQTSASKEHIFAAFSDPNQRASWSSPSEDATFFYEASDFRQGGRDVFRCGSKSNPQYRGTAQYISIIPNERIAWHEVIEASGQILGALLITTLIEAQAEGCRIQMTVQVTSFCGDGMIEGNEIGTNASLDNLMKYLAQKV